MPETAKRVETADLRAVAAIRKAILTRPQLASMSWSSLTGNLAETLACFTQDLLRVTSSESITDALTARGINEEEFDTSPKGKKALKALLTARGVQIKGVRTHGLTSMVKKHSYVHLFVLRFDGSWTLTDAWKLPKRTVEHLLAQNPQKDKKNRRKLRISSLRKHATTKGSLQTAYPIEDIRLGIRERLPVNLQDAVIG